MGKVTSKYQVSIPKRLADELRIKPGDEIEWRVAGDELRVGKLRPNRSLSVEERLEMLRAARERQATRDRGKKFPKPSRNGRGWTREDLYDRGRTR